MQLEPVFSRVVGIDVHLNKLAVCIIIADSGAYSGENEH